jgi:hypothetical protein
MYWDARGNIFKILKNSLQESLGTDFSLGKKKWACEADHLPSSS